MSDPSPIIDVNPVASTSDAAKSASPSGSDTFRAPSYGKDAAQAAVNATIIDEGRVSKKKPNRIGGAVQTAIGGAIMFIDWEDIAQKVIDQGVVRTTTLVQA